MACATSAGHFLLYPANQLAHHALNCRGTGHPCPSVLTQRRAGSVSQRTILRQGLTLLLRTGACSQLDAFGRGGSGAGTSSRSGSIAGADTHGVSDGLSTRCVGAEKVGACAPINLPPRLCSRSAA